MAAPKNNLQDMLGKLGQRSTTGYASGSMAGAEMSKKPTFTLARSITTAPKQPPPAPDPVRAHVHVSATSLPGPSRMAGLDGNMKPVTLGSSVLTPQSLNGSPKTRAGAMPRVSGSKNKLEAMPTEKLQNLIIKYMEELMALRDKKDMLGDEEDDMDEDPEMIDQKIRLLGKRIQELKDVVKSRTMMKPPGSPISSHAARSDAVSEQPASSGRSNHSVPQAHQGQPSQQRTVLSHPQVRPEPKTFEPPHVEPAGLFDGEEEVPLAKARMSYGRKAAETMVMDEDLVAMAEAMENENIVIPPSTPPRQPSPRSRRAAALAEMDHLPPEAFFSSPEAPKAHPPRTSNSASRVLPPQSQKLGPQPPTSQAAAGPGPSTQSSRLGLNSSTNRVSPPKIEATYQWTKEVEQKLRQVFRLPRFRMHQKEAVDATMAAKDVFVLMPTGGGKSLTYQLPAICSSGKTSGVTFVISPLISLINDQTRHLLQLDIPAIAYTGDMSAGDKATAHEALAEANPWTKVVYVTPEMMSMGGRIKHILRDLARRKKLARFVIDEAHCVSQWGHDFRSDYLKLSSIRKEYPGIPIMALTATAQNKVQDDIIRTLGIQGCVVLRQSFNRPNLHYDVRPKTKNVIKDIVGFIHAQRVDGKDVSGIIYCGSREKCEVLAKCLNNDYGMSAKHYHAGMSKGDRRSVQEGWQEHDFEIIVATVAFGMGIDKPDVRFVIHHSVPRSLEGYYQETGRGGRDGKPSQCILFYSYNDCKTVLGLIDRDEVLSRDQKDRQKDSMNEVVRFCMNKTDCRRSQVLSFFSETFDPADCNASCDVCLSRDQNVYEVEDVTADAVSILKMMGSFDEKTRVTVVSAAEIWRGANKASTKGFAGNKWFGAGKTWDRGEAERLVQTLLLEKALGEYNVRNGAGWTCSYLKLGPMHSAFIKGGKQLTMDFRQKSPLKALTLRKTKSTGSIGTAAGPGAAGKKAPKPRGGQANLDGFAQPSQRVISNPISRKRSLQHIAEQEDAFDRSGWGDTDDEDQAGNESRGGGRADDPIELPGDETERSEDEDDDLPLAKKRKSLEGGAKGNGQAAKGKGRASVAQSAGGGGAGAGAGGVMTSREDLVGGGKLVIMAKQADKEPVDRGSNVTPVQACLNALRQMIKKAVTADKHAPVIDQFSLEMVASTMPLNNQELAAIEGITSAHIKHYGPKILGICIKHVEMQEKANGLVPGMFGSRLPQTASSSSSGTSRAKGKAGTPASNAVSNTGRLSLAGIQAFAYKPPVVPNAVPLSAVAPPSRTASVVSVSLAKGGASRPRF